MKKMSKLILASMLTAGVFSLSGCIENLEPAGISDLRGAKAELLRAQTALQAAEAAKVQAEAQLKLAEAKVQEAIAKQEEAKVAFVEAQAKKMEYEAETVKLENEYLTLTNDAARIENEAARAKLEQQIKLYELEMQEAQNAAAQAAADLEVYLAGIQEQLARAQASYETALKEIELAKATLTPEEKTQLAALELAVTNARNDVETKTVAFINAGKALADATANADPEKGRENALRKAKKDLATAKAEFDAAVEAEKLAEEMMKLDATLEGWIAKQDELEAKKAELEKQYTETKAANDVREKDLTKELDAIKKKAYEYRDKTGYDFNENTGLFSIIPNSAYKSESFDLPEVYIAAPKNAEGESVASDFQYSGTYRFGEEKVVLDDIDATLENLRSMAEGTYLNTQIEIAESTLESHVADNDYKIAMTKYQDALAAYKSGDILTYFKKYNYYSEDLDIAKLVKDYNDALTAFEKAIAAYEAEASKFDNGDADEKETALYNKMIAAKNDADAAMYKAYQAAQSKHDAAELVWEKAQSVYNNAYAAYRIIKEDAEAVAGADYSVMKSYVDSYDPDAAHTPDETAQYDKYKAAVETIDKATETYNSADAAYNKALEEWNKADSEYNTAKNDAIKVRNRAYDAAQLEYDNALRELQASYPEFDNDYRDYLRRQMSNARARLAGGNVYEGGVYNYVDGAMQPLVDAVSGKYAISESYEDVYYYAAKGTDHAYSTYIYGVPDYLRQDTYNTVTNSMDYKMIPADLDKIKDLEVFKGNHLTWAADGLTHIPLVARVEAFDNNWYYVTTHEKYGAYYLTCDNYPEAIVSFEEFAKNHAQNLEEYKSYLLNAAEVEVRDMGYNVGYSVVSYASSAPVAYEYQLRMEIEDLKAQLADVALLPDFIREIEETRAEFVVLFEANEKEMEALKAEVEAAAPALIAEQEELDLAEETLKAEVDVMTEKIDVYVDLIKTYCRENSDWTATDKETFEKYLKEEYDAAVKATFDAETAYIDEQKTYADAEAGLLDAVATAERKLKIAEEELKEANDRLARATAELQAALGILYGTPSAE